MSWSTPRRPVLDLRRDRLIAIGAVAVERDRIALHDCFETVLRQDKASADANILIHGIGGQTQLGGVEPRAGDARVSRVSGQIAARRVSRRVRPGDARARACDRSSACRSVIRGSTWRSCCRRCFRGPSAGRSTTGSRHFGSPAGERHHALADAFATAQLLQIALVAADRVEHGRCRAADRDAKGATLARHAVALGTSALPRRAGVTA